VANYVFRSKWVSTQMTNKGDLWGKFQDYMIGNVKLLVNAFPDVIRPHVFEAKAPALYDFIEPRYIASNFEYYLDSNQDTHNIILGMVRALFVGQGS
jgi:hypothetical protein